MGQLTNWKFYVRRNPWPLLGAAAIVGYLLVPAKREKPVVIHSHSRDEGVPEPAKKGMLGGMAGALVTLALRSGTSFALRQLSDFWISKANPNRTTAAASHADGSSDYGSSYSTHRKRQPK
ncbi:MAG: hypothetical protein R3C05_19655 [Pirellulaceae bacterium]